VVKNLEWQRQVLKTVEDAATASLLTAEANRDAPATRREDRVWKKRLSAGLSVPAWPNEGDATFYYIRHVKWGKTHEKNKKILGGKSEEGGWLPPFCLPKG
jgi:hypothetical protein